MIFLFKCMFSNIFKICVKQLKYTLVFLNDIIYFNDVSIFCIVYFFIMSQTDFLNATYIFWMSWTIFVLKCVKDFIHFLNIKYIYKLSLYWIVKNIVQRFKKFKHFIEMCEYFLNITRSFLMLSTSFKRCMKIF